MKKSLAALAAVSVATVVTVGTAAGATGSPAASAATPSTTTSVPAAAAGWLAQQLVDGNHLVYSFDGTTFDGGGTADMIYALAASKSGKATVDRAVTYFENHVESYVDIKNADGYGPNDGGIGKTALAAMVAGADPEHFGPYNLLQHLKDDECAAASTSCTPGAAANIYSSISESLVLLAEARGSAIKASYTPSAQAIAYFLSLQCPDGGFTAQTAGGAKCASDVDATGYAMQALQALGNQSPALQRAAQYLVSKRSANGSWSSQGAANVDSTGLAAAGLHAAGRSADSSRRWLAGQQVTDGPTVGAGASRGALKYLGAFDAASSVKGTMDGMLGLVPATTLASLTAAGSTPGTTVLALDSPALRRTTITVGHPQTVTGTGFAAGERVRGVLRPGAVAIGTAKADSKGVVSLTFPVAHAGSKTVTLTGLRSGLSSSTRFTVRAAAAPSSGAGTSSASFGSSGALPTPSTSTPVLANTGRNGSQTQSELLLGALLIGLGAIALALGRRRVQGRHR